MGRIKSLTGLRSLRPADISTIREKAFIHKHRPVYRSPDASHHPDVATGDSFATASRAALMFLLGFAVFDSG
ncbi:hypothetical protein ACNKHX_01585 [Shigella flexneri]